MNTETQEARKARLMAKAQLLTMTRTQLDEYSAHVRNGSIAHRLLIEVEALMYALAAETDRVTRLRAIALDNPTMTVAELMEQENA